MISDNKALNLRTGWLCLDFANTADWHASENPVESLTSYQELLVWSRDVGLISVKDFEILSTKSKADSVKSSNILTDAIELREAIYRVFSNLAANEECNEADLNTINRSVSKAMQHFRLVKCNIGCKWELKYDAGELDSPLLPISHSATVLMTSDLVSRVGECADERGCGWLFFDTSRNRSRRWCDMRDCGNRSKVKRYYSRKRLPMRPYAMSEPYVRSRHFIPGMSEMVDTGKADSKQPWALP